MHACDFIWLNEKCRQKWNGNTIYTLKKLYIPTKANKRQIKKKLCTHKYKLKYKNTESAKKKKAYLFFYKKRMNDKT